MSVRENRPAATDLLGSRAKAAVLALLNERGATLSQLAARSGMTKSSVLPAVRRLMKAGIVVQHERAYAIAPEARSMVADIIALDDPARERSPAPGDFVALDAGGAVLVHASTIADLRAALRERRLRASLVMRVPEARWQVEGALGA